MTCGAARRLFRVSSHRSKFLVSIGFSFVAYAQSHGIEIIEAKNMRISSEHAALVRKYVINLSTPGTDGTSGGGAAVIDFENNYYIVTAKHCLKVRDASHSSSLKQKLHVYYSSQKIAVELDILKDALELREMGDLVRIKLPASHDLVKTALANHAIIKPYKGSLSAIKNEEIYALGRPQCLAGQSYAIRCKGDQSMPSGTGERPEVKLSNGKCFESNLQGMSSGPVLVKMNGEYLYLGAVSQHEWVGETFGPIEFAPIPELGAGSWKKCTVLLENDKSKVLSLN